MPKPKLKPKSKLKFRKRRSRSRFRACPPIALIAGSLLLIMAVPRFMSALVQLPGNYVIQRLEKNIDVNDAALSKLSSTRRGSLEWNANGQQWVELGLAQLRQAERNQDSRDILLSGAVSDLRKGLGMKPANGPGWLWLAEAELLRGGPSPAVARAIAMSNLTAPLDRRSYVRRIEISLLNWPQLDGEAKKNLAKIMQITKRKYNRNLGGLTRHPDYSELIQRIMKTNPKG